MGPTTGRCIVQGTLRPNGHVYRQFNRKGKLLYVGSTSDVMRRTSEHSHHKDWFGEVDLITVEHYETREQAYWAEEIAIKNERPLYNVVHNGQRSNYITPNERQLTQLSRRLTTARGIQQRVVPFSGLASCPEMVDGRLAFQGSCDIIGTPYEVYDSWGSFTEELGWGAFNKTLKDSLIDVALFIDYNKEPVATRLDGSLRLAVDGSRLVITVIVDAPIAQEIDVIIGDSLERQMLIGFSVPEKRDEWSGDLATRIVRELNMGFSISWRTPYPKAA